MLLKYKEIVFISQLQMIARILTHELNHLRVLSASAKGLLTSITLYELTLPVFTIFINAYIYRETRDVTAVALYNLGMFMTLPFTYLVNGTLLNFINVKILMLLGLILKGLALVALIYFGQLSLAQVFIFGLIQGVPLGLYWANRSFLGLECTKDRNRNYYVGLEMTGITVAKIIAPVVIGVVIARGEAWVLYSAHGAYQALSIISLIVLLLSAVPLFKMTTKYMPQTHLLMTRPSKRWSYIRLMEVLRGVHNSLDFFMPTLIVFLLVGREESLGTFQSISAIISLFLIYFVARHMKVTDRLKYLRLSLGLFFLNAAILFLVFTPLTAILYFLLSSFLAQLLYASREPLVLSVIEADDHGNRKHDYAYVSDREIFLNIGRAIGIVPFLFLLQHLSNLHTIRLLPLITATIQLGMLWSIRYLEKHRSR